MARLGKQCLAMRGEVLGSLLSDPNFWNGKDFEGNGFSYKGYFSEKASMKCRASGPVSTLALRLGYLSSGLFVQTVDFLCKSDFLCKAMLGPKFGPN